MYRFFPDELANGCEVCVFTFTGFQAAGSVGRPVSGTHAPSTTNGTSSHAEKTESHRGPQSNSSDSQYIAKIREVWFHFI